MKKRNKKRSGFMPDFSLKGEVARLPVLRDYNEEGQEGDALPQWELDAAWREVERKLKWLFETAEIVSSTNGARADLNILSQVTPRSLGGQKRDYAWLIAHAMRNGAKATALGSCEWNIAGDCSNPYGRTLKAPPFMDAHGRYQRRCALYIDIYTRCRKCEACLRHRAALWRIRARAETRDSVRTWFGTLTLRPEALWLHTLRAMDVSAKNGHVWERLSEKDKFVVIHNLISRDITLAIKRLRKNTGVPFKYLIVAEAHKSGAPHYHLLFHERNANAPLRYEALRAFWPHGFSQYRLVKEEKEAIYLCKYLSKSLLARVRASQRYGVENT